MQYADYFAIVTMKPIIPIICFSVLLFSCTRNTFVADEQARRQIDSCVFSISDIDSLSKAVEAYAAEENTYGEMVASRELGKKLRNASRFYDAIDMHKRGLAAAEKLRDTIQIVQALNNIGTNYRRLGILDEASSYHYKALT